MHRYSTVYSVLLFVSVCARIPTVRVRVCNAVCRTSCCVSCVNLVKVNHCSGTFSLSEMNCTKQCQLHVSLECNNRVHVACVQGRDEQKLILEHENICAAYDLSLIYGVHLLHVFGFVMHWPSCDVRPAPTPHPPAGPTN